MSKSIFQYEFLKFQFDDSDWIPYDNYQNNFETNSFPVFNKFIKQLEGPYRFLFRLHIYNGWLNIEVENVITFCKTLSDKVEIRPTKQWTDGAYTYIEFSYI